MRVRFPTSKIQIPKRLNKPCIEHKNRVWKRFCEILVALNLATSGSQTEHSNAEIQSERGPVITLMFSMQGEPLGWRLAGHLLPLHPCPNICSLIPKERVGEDLRNQKATQDTFYDSISQWCPLLALYSPPSFFSPAIFWGAADVEASGSGKSHCRARGEGNSSWLWVVNWVLSDCRTINRNIHRG